MTPSLIKAEKTPQELLVRENDYFIEIIYNNFLGLINFSEKTIKIYINIQLEWKEIYFHFLSDFKNNKLATNFVISKMEEIKKDIEERLKTS